ncbi:MAG: glycosyltransferase family 4 protein [Clostridia bacterium]|nr:glycosyltransferase family 4 protein [Clostridia bacterium]
MKVAFLTNILTPYRVYFFDVLYKQLGKDKLKCFVMTDKLPLRPWNYSELRREYTMLLKGKKVLIRGNDYLFSYNVRSAILEYDPDILIVAGSWTYPTTWDVMMSKKITKSMKILFWTESHNHTGIHNTTKTKPIARKIKQLLMKRFDGFCVPGEYAKETISNLIDLTQKTVIRLPNLIDNAYYDYANQMRKSKNQLREVNGVGNEQFVFFTPASMRELKGQLPFFKNVVNVVKGKPVTFVLAGEGPDREAIEKIGLDHDLNLCILRYQNQEQIREWFALSDAFLLPSLSDANPLSNIEAAWAGLPLCVSCYVGNGPELVEDGINGVIFDTLDVDSVSEKIMFVINQNKEWLSTAGVVSHRKAQEGFDAETESKKFLVSLEESLKY